MPLDASQVLQTVRELQLVAEDDLERLLDSLGGLPEDGEAFTGELIANRLLTSFQARMIHRGSGASLLLSSYVIEAPIGVGGMGRVFRARHRMMDRVVALKVLQRKSKVNPESLDRFLREVKVSGTLHHQNIVTAFDAGQSDGVPYLVMEYIDGRDLATVVTQGGPLQIQQAVEVVMFAAKALEYAHSKGIIHRDVKPANLLIDQQGTVKVLDLGLARWKADAEAKGEDDSDLSSEEFIRGTVHFLSPEQAENRKGLDHRTDIYSLGCTMYYLLTGEKVFPAPRTIDTLFAHQKDPPPRLTDKIPFIDPAVNDLFQWMMRKDPAERPETMQVVRDRAAEILSDIELRESRELRVLVDDRSPTRRLDESADRDVVYLEEATSGRRLRLPSRMSLSQLVLISLFVGMCVWMLVWQFTNRGARHVPPPVIADPNLPDVPVLPPKQVLIPAGLQFDGEQSQAVIREWITAADEPLTLEVEVTPRPGKPLGTVVAHFDGIDGWILGLCGEQWCLTLSQGGIPHVRLVSDQPVRWDEPQQVAMVLDGRRAALYVDGTLQTEFHAEPQFRWNQQTLRLGFTRGTYTDEDYWFRGMIHHLRISNVDRFDPAFASEVHELDPHTIGYYDCTSQRGTRLVDSSPEANHGDLQQTLWVGARAAK